MSTTTRWSLLSRRSFAWILSLALVALAACGPGEPSGEVGDAGTSGSDAPEASSDITAGEEEGGQAAGLPPDEAGATAALNDSPRHGEWVDVALPGSEEPIRTWVVYPERADDAPVVIVIQEIFGLTDWIRGVADQFAAEGFIALAPDLLSGMGPGGGGTESVGSRDEVVALVRELSQEETNARLDAVREFAMAIPAASGEVGTVGFCWGGGASFAYAVHRPELDAAVVYYGTSPDEDAAFNQISAPVLGLYGGDDQRVNATIPTARDAMDDLGKTYETEIYDGAGHGFLRAQSDREGANERAARQAWERTVEFFREHLEGA